MDQLAEAMSADEFWEWSEWFKMQNEEHEKSMAKAQANRRARGARRGRR